MTAENKEKFTQGTWVGFDNGKWADCGAWSVNNDEASSHSYVAVNVGDVTICLVVSDSWDDKEMEANAHLIAAAPEMYDLLNSIDFDDGAIENALGVGFKESLEALLAKARGEL